MVERVYLGVTQRSWWDHTNPLAAANVLESNSLLLHVALPDSCANVTFSRRYADEPLAQGPRKPETFAYV